MSKYSKYPNFFGGMVINCYLCRRFLKLTPRRALG